MTVPKVASSWCAMSATDPLVGPLCVNDTVQALGSLAPCGHVFTEYVVPLAPVTDGP